MLNLFTGNKVVIDRVIQGSSVQFIENLKPFRTYKVIVLAWSNEGASTKETIEVTTEEAGKFISNQSNSL